MTREMKMTPTQTIGQIDKAIDANRAEMQRRVGRKIRSTPGAWQKAWDAHPYLRAKDHELFRQRGIAQQARDVTAHKVAVKVERATQRRDAKIDHAKFKTEQRVRDAASELLAAAILATSRPQNITPGELMILSAQARDALRAAISKATEG
jgi:hypothetical protein